MKTPESEFFERLQTIGGVKPTAPTAGSVVEKELKEVEQDFSTPLTIRNLFTHHDAHPIVIDLSLLKAFGLEWWLWEQETIEAEIQRVFKTQISEHAKVKIQTVKTLHVSPAPWQSWQVFEKIIQGLNNNIPRWELMQAPSLDQLYAGLDMMDTLRQEDFSDEVKQYIAAAVLHEDVFFVPPPLDFVQEFVAQPYWHCKDCGNEDLALFHDGICDTCTKKFDPENNLSMIPDRELVQQGKGKNLELRLKFDPDPTQRRWDELKSEPLEKIQFQEVREDIQVAKLLIARDYMNIRRRQLAEQLTSLKSWLGAS